MKAAFTALVIGATITALLFDTEVGAEPGSFKPLKRGFDNEFRFNNQYNLTGRIAFTADINGYDRILVLDLDKKRIVPLIDGPGNNLYPDWSPDGEKIAFTSDRDGNKEIYISNKDGSNQVRITENPLSDDNSSWHPDGSSLAYYSGNDSRSGSMLTNLFIYDFSKKKASQLTNFKGKNSTPDYSPDGNLITYTTSRFWPGWDVCIFDLIEKQDSCPLSGTSTYCRPAFSHDGKRIAYSSGLVTSVDAYIYDVVKKSSEPLIKGDGNEYDLKWDATDQFILFASDKREKGIYNLYVVKVDDGSVSQLLSGPHSMRYMSWFQPKQN